LCRLTLSLCSGRCVKVAGRPATKDELLLVHDPAFVERFLRLFVCALMARGACACASM
jgi:hypothetical protein